MTTADAPGGGRAWEQVRIRTHSEDTRAVERGRSAWSDADAMLCRTRAYDAGDRIARITELGSVRYSETRREVIRPRVLVPG